MNYQNKYLKYKKKYIELKSQMGGMLMGPMNNDNIEQTFLNYFGDYIRKYIISFFDIDTLENVRLINKNYNKEISEIITCIKSCDCVNLKPNGQHDCFAVSQGVCKQYCKLLTNESIRIAVKEWVNNRENAIAKYGDMSTWDTRRVTNMSTLFEDIDFDKLDWYGDIGFSNWNVSNVKNMFGMFRNAKSFNEDISEWDVGNVTDMSRMFNNATTFNQPLNNWDVSNVTDMGSMFSYAESFNKPLNDWDVSNVENMVNMFYAAEKFNQPLDKWNVSKVTDMDFMFYGADSFDQILKRKNIYKKWHDYDKRITCTSWDNIDYIAWDMASLEYFPDRMFDSDHPYTVFDDDFHDQF